MMAQKKRTPPTQMEEGPLVEVRLHDDPDPVNPPVQTKLGYIENNSTEVCRRGYPVGWACSFHGKVVPIWCGSWSCVKCGKQKAKKLRRRIESCEVNGWHRLWTLTLRGVLSCQLEKESGRVMNRFLLSLQRCYPRTKIFWVREWGTKHGRLHFHAAVDRYLPRGRVETLWIAAGGGWLHMKDIGQDMGRYMCKYLSKSDTKRGVKGLRRFSSSRHLVPATPRSSDIWFFTRIESVAQEWYGLSCGTIHQARAPNGTVAGGD